MFCPGGKIKEKKGDGVGERLNECVGCSCYPRGDQPKYRMPALQQVVMENTAAFPIKIAGKGNNKSVYRYRTMRSSLLLLPILLRDNERASVSEPTLYRPSDAYRTRPIRNANHACLGETSPDAVGSFPSPEHDVTKQFSL